MVDDGPPDEQPAGQPTVKDPDPSEEYQTTVGISWFGGTFEGYQTLSHDGEDDGFLTQMVLVEECGAAVVWMSNGDDEAVANEDAVELGLQNITHAALRLVVGGCGCARALEAACCAERGDVFACADCAGAHQQALRDAGCGNDAIAAFCSSTR